MFIEKYYRPANESPVPPGPAPAGTRRDRCICGSPAEVVIQQSRYAITLCNPCFDARMAVVTNRIADG